MSKRFSKTRVFTILIMTLLGGALVPAQAEKPSWAGNKGNNSHNKKNMESGSAARERTSSDISLHLYFGEEQRKIVHNYFVDEYHRGHCPPGLAKKKNGCMPPGQAKKWKLGSPLPRDVVSYDLPNSLVVKLGRPPEGHRYVRVASDILLLAVGTGLVVDAIQDLSSL